MPRCVLAIPVLPHTADIDSTTRRRRLQVSFTAFPLTQICRALCAADNMQIGPYTLKNNLVLAPMAGVTDRPFRQLCKQLGAGMAVSEMVSSNSLLWGSAKTQRRANHVGETEPKSVQIAGADPAMMAHAARYNADQGAEVFEGLIQLPAEVSLMNALLAANAGGAGHQQHRLAAARIGNNRGAGKAGRPQPIPGRVAERGNLPGIFNRLARLIERQAMHDHFIAVMSHP